MTSVQVGEIRTLRVEESLVPGFDPALLFPNWDPKVPEAHRRWLEPNFCDAASAWLITSVRTRVIRTPRHPVLIYNCTGNLKARQVWQDKRSGPREKRTQPQRSARMPST